MEEKEAEVHSLQRANARDLAAAAELISQEKAEKAALNRSLDALRSELAEGHRQQAQSLAEETGKSSALTAQLRVRDAQLRLLESTCCELQERSSQQEARGGLAGGLALGQLQSGADKNREMLQDVESIEGVLREVCARQVLEPEESKMISQIADEALGMQAITDGAQ